MTSQLLLIILIAITSLDIAWIISSLIMDWEGGKVISIILIFCIALFGWFAVGTSVDTETNYYHMGKLKHDKKFDIVYVQDTTGRVWEFTEARAYNRITDTSDYTLKICKNMYGHENTHDIIVKY